jgi:hypothetical protein
MAGPFLFSYQFWLRLLAPNRRLPAVISILWAPPALPLFCLFDSQRLRPPSEVAAMASPLEMTGRERRRHMVKKRKELKRTKKLIKKVKKVAKKEKPKLNTEVDDVDRVDVRPASPFSS